ncbi:hypothetical protein [uncultured Microbacterium sp.]|uniref:hypothetical protein n=1 Tax=uncultured Microbacterium sp. TaxID=191216 RepID=UPI0028D81E3A|nr:hypothetical protein [uncultured Microbacterium sp.]
MIRRLAAVGAGLVLCVGVLAGCTPAPSSLSPELSSELQQGVVAVAESASAGDAATALVRLDELQQRLDAAVTAGDVSTQRATAIQSAIDAVRADLQPAPLPSVDPAPQPTVDPGVTDEGNDNSGPGNNNGNGDDDKGKGKGKGKGEDD